MEIYLYIYIYIYIYIERERERERERQTDRQTETQREICIYRKWYLLNTQRYKVRSKGKVKQYRERCITFSYTSL